MFRCKLVWILSGIYQVFIIYICLDWCDTGYIETEYSNRKGNTMFYAIEYAYGRNVVNNGNRGDRVLEFTAKRLRDAWVADGSEYDGTGARDILKARDSRVRGVEGLEDGDNYGWRVIAQQRVKTSVALSKYHNILMVYDWTTYDHCKWVAAAPEREILDWAEAVRQAEMNDSAMQHEVNEYADEYV